ncbi:MAG: 4-(cytidine 5'-diphospho)-2-C-methyl-D-erythritol kinase [Betaproteobacteria bacterium]|nr:MAG: 4-(cytidine 5'-diphospho)-2-C-methyl-D-erythritol kinase [Betaproteobacteria bacterium]
MSGWQQVWPAPAKLNLFLHVTGRRADGYHSLQTAFRLIDLADTLRFTARDDGKVTLRRPLAGVPPQRDLCLRAAALLKHATGHSGGIEIELDKRIPMCGGLGGGSSDAATTLVVLNHLWRLGLKRRELQQLALKLGADVPLFVFGENAFAEGIGEQLRPLVLPAAWYLVLVPPVEVPTAAVFAAPELTRDAKPIKITAFFDGLKQRALRNDLEPVVSRRYPEVARHLAWLKQHGGARMSGSGACVYAEFSTESAAHAAHAQLPQTMRGFVARGLERHPLHELTE